ncbi:unnamed protein product, partial [Schistocephalus solidus]|uniref:Fibronectin type-III domain-containing protein n=1 Tax=Schistocephalus solidus TaxID=70667 RepID=A0A183T1M7_SCHSO
MCCLIISADVASNLLKKQPSEESETSGSLYKSTDSPSGIEAIKDVASNLLTERPSEESDTPGSFFTSTESPSGIEADNVMFVLSLMIDVAVLRVGAGSVAAYAGMEMTETLVENDNGGLGEPLRWGVAYGDWWASVDVASTLLIERPIEELHTPGKLYTSTESPSGIEADNDVASTLLAGRPSEESDAPGSLYTSSEFLSGIEAENGRHFSPSSSCFSFCSYPSCSTSLLAVHISGDGFDAFMPRGLTAVALNSTSIHVSWESPNVSIDFHYLVIFSSGFKGWKHETMEVEFTPTELKPSSTYHFTMLPQLCQLSDLVRYRTQPAACIHLQNLQVDQSRIVVGISPPPPIDTSPAPSPPPPPLSLRHQQGVQIIVELILRHVRAHHWGSVGTDNGGELVSLKRRAKAHEAIIDTLRQTGQTCQDDLHALKSNTSVASLCLWLAAPEEGVAGTHHLQLTLLRESGLAESSTVHLVARQFSRDKHHVASTLLTERPSEELDTPGSLYTSTEYPIGTESDNESPSGTESDYGRHFASSSSSSSFSSSSFLNSLYYYFYYYYYYFYYYYYYYYYYY